MKPKIAVYSQAIGGLTQEEQDTIAKADLLIYAGRPEIVGNLRVKNPLLKLAWKFIPQFVDRWDNKWVRDILWSPLRAYQRAVEEHPGWWMRDIHDHVIFNEQGQRVVNWTPYCPRTTTEYGSCRVSEYLAKLFIDMAKNERFWPRWSWEDTDTVNAIAFDVLADCLGTIGPTSLADADPDNDDEPEGVSKPCSQGGNVQTLTGLMRIENTLFHRMLVTGLPDVPIILGDVSKWSGPSWYRKAWGYKLENWMRVHDWDEWWYGKERGVGYYRTAVENPHKTNYTLLYVRHQPDWSKEANEKRMMYGLCTTLLLDGYFVWTEDERHPLWHPAFNFQIGYPLEDPTEIQPGLWRRKYSEVTIIVNSTKEAIGPYEAESGSMVTLSVGG